MPDIVKTTYPRFHPHRWCDNGMLVQAGLQSGLVKRLNQTLRWRTKEIFRYVGQVNSIATSAGASERFRWRHAAHTGTYTDKLGVYFLMAPQRVGSGDPYSQFKINGGGSLTHHYGNTGGSPPDFPLYFGHSYQEIDVAADTDYEFTWSDFADGRLISGLVFEISSAPTVSGPYINRNVAVLSPIQDGEREDPMDAATDAWKRNGAHCFNFTTDIDADARTRTSTTDINLVDNSSTTISAATPGFTLDMRYKDRRGGGAEVPIVFKAYGKTAGGGTGHVYLKDSAGNVKATLNINSATDAWYSTTAVVDALEGKIDVHYDGDGVNLTTVRACSVYEYSA